MKKLMQAAGLFMALFFFTTSVSAQEGNAEAMAKLLTDSMKAKLTLNEAQYKQAYDANLEFVTASKAVKDSDAKRIEKGRKLKALDEARDQKMKAFLTEEQFGAYLVMKKENREKIRERRAKQ